MSAGKLTYLNMEEAYNNFESKKVLAASKMILVERSIDLSGMIVILNCALKVRRESLRNAEED